MKITAIVSILFFSIFAKAAFDVGSVAPTIELPILNQGIESSIAINKASPGQKVVLEFFATGCSSCAENMANVRNFSAEFAGKAVFRLVGVDRQEQATRDFAKENPDFIVAVDSKRQAKRAYEIQSTPTTFIISEDNKVLFIGLNTWTESEKNIMREILSK